MITPGAAERRGPGEIAEDEATGRTVETYARLRDALGTPFVPTVFRLLARHETYLATGVDALLARLDRDAIAELADAVRERAALAALELPGPPLDAGDDRAAVAALLRRYNVVNPRGIVLVRALRGDVARPPAAVMRAPLPRPVAATLEDVRAAHGGLTVPGMWRELAELDAGVATAAWARIRPLAGAAAFDAARADIGEWAGAAVAAVVTPDPARLGCRPEDQREIAMILDWFVAAIPALVVEIEVLDERLGGQ